MAIIIARPRICSSTVRFGRHQGGNTAGDDTNGFNDTNSINEDNLRNNKRGDVVNIEMDGEDGKDDKGCEDGDDKKAATTDNDTPSSSIASTTGWSRVRAAMTVPEAPSPQCHAILDTVSPD